MKRRIVNFLILALFSFTSLGVQCLCGPDCDHEWHDMLEQSEAQLEDEICRYRPDETGQDEDSHIQELVNSFFNVCCEKNFFYNVEDSRANGLKLVTIEIAPSYLRQLDFATPLDLGPLNYLPVETPPPV